VRNKSDLLEVIFNRRETTTGCSWLRGYFLILSFVKRLPKKEKFLLHFGSVLLGIHITGQQEQVKRRRILELLPYFHWLQ